MIPVFFSISVTATRRRPLCRPCAQLFFDQCLRPRHGWPVTKAILPAGIESKSIHPQPFCAWEIFCQCVRYSPVLTTSPQRTYPSRMRCHLTPMQAGFALHLSQQLMLLKFPGIAPAPNTSTSYPTTRHS